MEGLFPVVPTPLHEDEAFDEKGFAALLDALLQKGFHGFTILGSNSEAPYFSLEEKVKILDAAAKQLNGKIQWIAGTGCMGTAETTELTKYAHKAGASACLVALPTYYSLSFESVYNHYKTVSEKSGSPVLFYNFPACTRLALAVPQVIKICELDGIIGMKATILNVKTIKAQIQGIKKKPFYAFSGTTYLLSEAVRLGGAGAICPVPLLMPEVSLSLYDAVKGNDGNKIQIFEKKIFQTLRLFSKNASPAAAKMFKLMANFGVLPEVSATAPQAMLKEFLRLSGIPVTAKVRSPLPQLTEEQKVLVKKLFNQL